jgi:hypothetical protein
MATEWHSEQFVFCSCQPYPQSGIRNLIWAKFSKQCATKCTFADHCHAPVPTGSSWCRSITTVIIVKAHEYCLIYLTECLWCRLWTFSTEISEIQFSEIITLSDSWNQCCIHAGWPWFGIISSFWMKKPRAAQAVSYYHEIFSPRWVLICIILTAIILQCKS